MSRNKGKGVPVAPHRGSASKEQPDAFKNNCMKVVPSPVTATFHKLLYLSSHGYLRKKYM